MSDQGPAKIDLNQWQEQAAPFVDDLISIVHKHMRELPRGALAISMIRYLALYNQVHETEPEDSEVFQAFLHDLVDALCKEAREVHKQGDLPNIFAPLQ